MKFECIHTSPLSAEANMAYDSSLLQSLAIDPRVILHFYRWNGMAMTCGYFHNPFDFLSKEGVEKYHIDIGRRPTGGGLLFHHCDLAFAVLIPANHPSFSFNTLDNYALVNQIVVDVIHDFLGDHPLLLREEIGPTDICSSHFCMAKPTKYDVMVGGRKVGGAAQRRSKHGLLHQGTISLTMPSQGFLEDVLLPNTGVIDAMKANSYPLVGEGQNIDEVREHLQQKLLQKGTTRLAM